MAKILIKISVLLALLFSYASAEDRQILIINSYHKGFQWSDDVIDGIESVLKKDISVNVNTLYMDSKRINSSEYYKKILELWKVQLRNHKYDLIIAVDKFAYDFILRHYEELFTPSLILFSGLERNSLDEIYAKGLENKIYGVYERRAFNETIHMISNMIPGLKKLYIINDQSENGNDSHPFILQAIEESDKKFEIEYIRDSTLGELEERFSTYKNDEAIFYVRFYNDKYGNFYRNNQIAATLQKLKLPVFLTDTLFVGIGGFGGKLVAASELGVETGKLAIDILNKKVPPLHTTTLDKYEIMFDLNKVKEFNLQPKTAVQEYTAVNAPQTFFDKYRDFINVIFIISPFLFFLILGLFYNLFARIKNEKRLKFVEEEKNKHQQFVIQQSKLAEIGEVFSSIAHQWKSPLVEIATIAQEQAFAEKNKKSVYVREIMTQVKYMTDTIDGFQRFITPSAKRTDFKVSESIKSILKIMDHSIRYNYIDIKFNAKAENSLVNGYKNEFMQTLLNIINNAKDVIKDAKNAGYIKRGIITFNLYNAGGYVVLEIQDNGGGIKAELLPNIFEAYFTTKKGGHGIGLYMTKIIIEDKMGGKISVSNRDFGACFTIKLRSVV